MGIARYLSKLASGLSSEGVVSAAKGGTGSTSGATGGSGPKITAITVTDSGYNNLDDTAVDVAGGYIKLTGSGFASGCQVLVGSIPATSTTYVSATEVRAQVPATTAGTYIVYLVNSDGGVAIRVNGITFSTTPTWTTGSGLSASVNAQISIQLAATGASTFSVANGSSLPSGVTLSSSGLLSGSVTGLSSPTTYTFTILATDTELQDSPRTFSFSISVGEPYFKYVSLLLSADGTNAAQNNTFVDSSTNNFAITRAGNATQGTFSPYGANWSNYFDGTGDYLSVATNSAFNLGAGDFTIECWFNSQSFANAYGVISRYDHVAGSGGYGWVLRVINSTTLRFVYGNDIVNDVTVSLNTNSWYHLAISRSGTTARMFLNGTQVGSFTVNNFSDASSALQIGRTNTVTDNAYAYITDVRIVKGSAVYTTAFTPPTAPLTAISGTSLLTCQSNRFIDNSTNAFTITKNGDTSVQRFSPFSPSTAYSTSTIGGSGYFVGASAVIIPTTQITTGSFTAECWFYRSADPANYHIIFGGENIGAGGTVNTQLVVRTTGAVGFVINAANATAESATGAVPLGQWSHIAWVRSGTTCAIFVNGTRVATGTSSDTLNIKMIGSGGDGSGAPYSASYSTVGYISDARITTSAVYDPAQTTLIVPAAPLTAIANTQLLCNFTNAGIYDAAMMNDLEIVGNVQLTTSVKKYGTAAIAFDGTGDYLNIANSNQLNFGTGDFTVECWAYFNSLTNTPMIWQKNAGNSGWFFEVGTSSIYFGHGTASGTQYYQLTASLNTGTWYHLAVTRVGNILSIFINGVKYSSAVNGAENSVDNTAPFIIGSFQPTNGSYDLNGYIDDFRITKGYARYTANFTPPTSAHSLQ